MLDYRIHAAFRSLALRLRQYLRIASEIFLDFAAAAAFVNFFIYSLSLLPAEAPCARRALPRSVKAMLEGE